jgi:hypothetical protein
MAARSSRPEVRQAGAARSDRDNRVCVSSELTVLCPAGRMPAESFPVFERIRLLNSLGALVCVLGMVAVLAPLPSSAGQDGPFRIPKEELRSSVKTIALESLRVEEGMVAAGADLRRSIEATIQKQLGQAGFRVVPPSASDEARRSVAGKLGGLYDPITGRADAQKLRTAEQLIASELARLHGADAVLTPHLVYDSVQADLDGILLPFTAPVRALGERIVWRGQPMSAGGDVSYPQKVVVNSIVVRIRDLALNDLYIHDMPIEWTRVYAIRTYQDRPGGELKRPEVIRGAIERVLAPLQPGPDAATK